MVVDGVVEDAEFCLLTGPNAGKSSGGDFGLPLVVLVELGVLFGTTTLPLVWDILCIPFCPPTAFWRVDLGVVVVVVDVDEEVVDGVTAAGSDSGVFFEK